MRCSVANRDGTATKKRNPSWFIGGGLRLRWLLGQALEVWGLDGRLGVGQGDAVVHVVDDDEQDIWFLRFTIGRAAAQGE